MSGARFQTARAVMIQGAGSNVGKSLIVAGLCRHFARQGLTVRPFKPQNMSNNAAATAEGAEIGRAQALQARAAFAEPHSDMNPVLLKPESERGAQVILQGRKLSTCQARDYKALKPRLLRAVLQSYARLAAQADIVIVEGAGSPAEVNLRAADIANMGFAEAADLPVILLGDIDRGGVIAQMIGAQAVLAPDDAARIKGFIINKFRGDPTLFEEGYRFIEKRSGWRGCGVLPWFDQATDLPAEDALDLERGQGAARGAQKECVIACPMLPRIANFDDLDPLRLEPSVDLRLVPRGEPLPADADLIILPGSKSTRADLEAIREEGWDIDLAAHRRRGGRILGICGGYQMLGGAVRDPEGLEGPPGASSGLGHLDVETVMQAEKRLGLAQGRHVESGAALSGYEIHIGKTTGPDCARPFAQLGDAAEGARSADGRVEGAYLHGLFASDAFRAAYLAGLGASSDLAFENRVESALNALADHIAEHADLDAIAEIAGLS